MTNYCRYYTSGYYNPNATKNYAPDITIEPTHIKFDFDFDIENQTIIGKVQHHLKFNADTEELFFRGQDLDIRSVTDQNGSELVFDNTGKNIHVRYTAKEGNQAIITFDYKVIKPAAGFYFVIPDEKYPNVSKQVWSQFQDEDGHFVAPLMDNPRYKHTSEVIGRIPKEWTSLSNGNLVSDEVKDDKRVMHWKFDIQHSTYLVTFAAGDLSEYKEENGDIEIRWYAERGREDEAKNSYGDTAKILNFFSEFTRFTYPYNSYSQWSASRFIFGGMENTTATTQTDLTLRDDRAMLDSSSNGLVAHEAAHQWFGDWITAKSWAHAWLHESFATYFDALYTEHSKGRDEFVYQMRSNKLSYISEDSVRYRRPIVTGKYEEPIDIFDSHLYPGGSWRVHMLRNYLGNEKFRDVMGYYLNKHGQGSVETVDLSRAIEEVTGKNMDWFFDQWLYQAGYPKLKLSYKWDNKQKLASVTIKQIQKLNKNDNTSTKLFKLHSCLSFVVEGNEKRVDIEIKEREQNYLVYLDEKPEFVRFDPDYTILATVDFDKPESMLLKQLKQDVQIIGKILAIKKLQKKPNYKVVEAIGNTLLDEEQFWGVRSQAASALGEIGGNQVKEVLIKGLETNHPKARRAIVKALAKFVDDQQVADAITIKIQQGDPSYFVEAELLQTLGKLRVEGAYETIIDHMDKPTFNDLSLVYAINGIVSLDDDRVLDKIIELAQYGAPEVARNSAIRAIGKVGKFVPERHDECLREFKKFSNDPLWRARYATISGLEKLENSKGIAIIRKMMEKEADGRIKKTGHEAISSIRKAQSTPKELKSLQTKVDKLTGENNTLKSRLDKLEKILSDDQSDEN